MSNQFANSPWNSSARRELLARLAEEGLAASKIAERINEEMPHNAGPISRNAILGACHRMRITMQSPIALYVRSTKRADVAGIVRVRKKRERRPRVKKEPKSKSWGFGRSVNWTAPKPRPPPVDDKEKPPLKISLLELTSSTCRWPIGAPRDPDFGFCGHRPRADSIYCGYHRKLAYAPGSALKTPMKPPPEKNIVEAA